MPDTDNYLLISGIQHFGYCRRQWALIHIESLWEDNVLTISGELMHNKAHDRNFVEKRGSIITVRNMPIFSHELRARGACDVVEFRTDSMGVNIFGRDGLWLPRPVEYKRGRPKKSDEDRLQLCAQAICLEEMLLCPAIETACLYYGETRHRDTVALTVALRDQVKAMFSEMHSYYTRSMTPKVKKSKKCKNCSFNNVCLSSISEKGSVAIYIRNSIREA